MDKKYYFNVILIASFFLLIFPFLAFPEIIEDIYVIIFSFIIAYFSLVLRRKILGENESDVSLQEYVEELKNKFKKQEVLASASATEKKSKKISEVLPHE